MRLLSRTTRSVSTTEAGETMLRSLRPALEDIASGVDAVGALRGKASGTVRITATKHAVSTVVMPALPRFLASHPDIQGGYDRRRQSDRHRRGTHRRRHPLRRHRREGHDRGPHRAGHPDGRRRRAILFRWTTRCLERPANSRAIAASTTGTSGRVGYTLGTSRRRGGRSRFASKVRSHSNNCRPDPRGSRGGPRACLCLSRMMAAADIEAGRLQANSGEVVPNLSRLLSLSPQSKTDASRTGGPHRSASLQILVQDYPTPSATNAGNSKRRRLLPELVSQPADAVDRQPHCISFAHLTAQFRFEAIGIFKIHRHLVVVEGQRPGLDFSTPQDPPFHRKGAFVDPASLGGIDPVKCGGLLR